MSHDGVSDMGYWTAYEWPFDAKGVHRQCIQPPSKALVERPQRIVQLVQALYVGAQRGGLVDELGECWLEEVEPRGRGAGAVLRPGEGGQGAGGYAAEGVRWRHLVVRRSRTPHG